MMLINFDWSNRFFTRLIWQSLEMHEDDKRCICSFYFSLESSIVPRSLTCATGSRVFPIKLILGMCSICWSSCCDPITINLVLSGFINNLLLPYHSNTLSRSSRIDKECPESYSVCQWSCEIVVPMRTYCDLSAK